MTNESAIAVPHSGQSGGRCSRRCLPLASLPPSIIVTVVVLLQCGQSYETCIVLTRLPTRLTSRAIALPPSGDALGTPLRKMLPPPGPQRASVETPDHGLTRALGRSALAVSLVEQHDGDGVDPDEFEAPALRRSRAPPATPVQARQFGHAAGLGCPDLGSAKPDGSDELVPGSGETANRVNTQNELCVGGWVRRTPTNEVGQAPSRAVPS